MVTQGVAAMLDRLRVLEAPPNSRMEVPKTQLNHRKPQVSEAKAPKMPKEVSKVNAPTMPQVVVGRPPP